MTVRVYITRAVPDIARETLLHGLPGAAVTINSEDRNLEESEIARYAEGCDALLCTLADQISRSLLKTLSPKLRVVSTFAVGVNNIDLEAARELGIAVCNTPGVLTDATAEIAVGLMLACARRMAEGDILTRQGRFPGWSPLYMRGHGVYGKTVGIVGAGRIGKRVAATMRHGFDCRILYNARSRHQDWEHELGAQPRDLDELLAESDFVSLHCPLTPETRHLLDARRLALLKPHAVLVNTARGPVIDEAALVNALHKGLFFGAGLDVYEAEPALAPGLASLPNTVLLPHLGSATVETRDEMGRMAARAIVDVLTGQEPKHRVA